MRAPLGRVFLALLVSVVLVGAVVGCEKKIVNVIPLAGVQILDAGGSSPPQLELLEGESESLQARLTGPEGQILSGRPVTWRTDDTGVASITPTGTLQAVSPGTTFAHAQVETLQASVAVTVLKGPTIALSSQALQLQGPSGESLPIEIVVLVENPGNGVLSGLSVSVSQEGGEDDWLVATLQNPSAPTTLLVQAFTENLPAGVYRGTITIADSTAVNSPQTIQVELQVGEALPRIQLEPTAVQFVAPSGAFQPAIQDVSIQNVGGGVLEGLQANVTYISGGAIGWLSTLFATPSAPTTVELSGSARFLPAGTYVATVEVTATSAPSAAATATVTFTVQ